MRWFALFAAAFLTLNAPAHAQEIYERIDAFVQRTMSETGQPGAAVGVVRNGQLVWARGYGFADVERRIPMTPQTLVRGGSLTKPLTAVAIMHLRDAGALALSDSIAAHLPQVRIAYWAGDTRPVTIEHLLTHTGGLQRDVSGADWGDGAYPTAFPWREPITQVLPLGRDHKYSNTNFVLLGQVIERASGQPYADSLRARVLAPLGMNASMLDAPHGFEGLALGYIRPDPSGPFRAGRLRTGAGIYAPTFGLSTNVEDLARFVAFMMQPSSGGPVAADTVREMAQPHFLFPGWRGAWGLGLEIWRTEDHTRIGHSGVSPDGFRSEFAWSPELGVGVIVVSNSFQGVPAILPEAFRLFAAEAAAAPTRPPAPANVADYIGVYRSRLQAPWRPLVADGAFVLDTGGLFGREPLLLAPTEDRDTFDVQSPGTMAGERVIFDRNSSGRVRALRTGTTIRRRQ